MIGLGIVGLLAQLGWATLNFSALPVWVQFDLKRGHELGLILGTFMLTEAVLRPSLGGLSDRIGRKPLLLAGPAMGIFTSFLTIYTGNLYLLILLRALDGVGLAAFWPAAFAAVSEAVDEKSRSTAMAVVNGTGMAGWALGFPLGGLVNDLYHSHEAAFWFVSGIFVLTVIAGLIIFPRQLYKHEHVDHQPGSAHKPDVAEVRSIFHLVPDMITLSVVVFAAMFLVAPVVKLYAMEQLAMSETRFGLVLAPVAAVLGILAIPFGKLADRLGKLVSVCYGMLICSAAMWMIAIVRCMFAVVAAGALLGVGFALAFPAWMAVVSQAAPPDKRGRVVGAVGMAQGMGALVGTALGPWIYASDYLSLPRMGVMNQNLPFYLCALLLSVGTVMTFAWISRLRAPQSSGRHVTLMERRAVIAAAVIGGIVVCGWVGMRYTRPVAPDRVAWLWVQAAVRGDSVRTERYTLSSFDEASPRLADNVYKWFNKRKAYYTPPHHPKLSDGGRRAEVKLIFHFPDRHTAKEVIILFKQPSSGEWKIAGHHAVQ